MKRSSGSGGKNRGGSRRSSGESSSKRRSVAKPAQHPRTKGAQGQARGAQHGGGRSARPRKDTSGSAPAPHGLVEGIVSANRAGYGFVRIEGMTDSVFLPPPEMNGVMHGDRVRIRVERGRDGRYAGALEAIVDRGVQAFLGTLEMQGRSAFVHSADRRLSLRGFVPPDALNGAKHGDWVLARVTKYPQNGGGAQAAIIRRLDPERPVEMATETAIARYALPVEFSAEAVREAEGYGASVDSVEAARRIDLRETPLVTIDGEDARDFDDAVYAEPHEQGFRLIVAIADVSHYVRPGSALDKEALERATSVYFPSRVLPMLPEALSNHLCSLAPKVDRLCFAADMIVSKQGQLRSSKFYPAVMRSHARLTYTQANAALLEGRPEAREQIGLLLDRLQPLVDVFRALHKARTRRGALDFDAPEATFDIDTNDRIRAINMYSRNDAHRLIEECMILANVAVALELAHQRVGTLYRVHGEPEDRKIDVLITMLEALGIGVDLPEKIEPRHLREITQRVGQGPARPFVESLVVRSMQQAIYQPANIGHFGLALKAYAHFTSPIRRYPDLVVHRTLKAMMGIAAPAGVRYSEGELAALGESTSRLEKRADESDRYVDTFLKCSYLRERVGQVFEGLITTVVEFGCFVQIIEVGVDGLLHTDTLRDDRYVMDTSGHAWIGLANKRRLEIGARIHVIVTNANPIEGLVDLELAEPAVESEGAGAEAGDGASGGAREPRASRESRESREPRDRSRSSRHATRKRR